MAYYAYYTQLKNVTKDPKSDNLYTAFCMSEQVIVGADAYEGQEVLYLPADGQLDYDFAMAFNLLRKDKDGNPAGGYLDTNRHIRALKLRGLRSEGIAISIERVKAKYPEFNAVFGAEFNTIGDTVFCNKYIPKQRRGSAGGGSSYKGKKAEGVIYPEFSMHSDTAQLAYNEAAFHPGDRINISLKMHGTSQRSMSTYGEHPYTWWQRLLNKIGIKTAKKVKPAYVLGTRRVVVTNDEGGYYGNDEFRFKHHEALKPFITPGMEVFYEVVGYVNKDTTIMPTGDNKKLNDKAFVKKFGPQTVFSYGCEPGESKMFVYRIVDENTGNELGCRDYTPEQIIRWCEKAGANYVPQVCNFDFTTWEDLQNRINDYFTDLTDPVGKDHIKEGVVVRILNRRTFTAFKSKTYEFKVLEGIIKETATEADMEESQE